MTEMLDYGKSFNNDSLCCLLYVAVEFGTKLIHLTVVIKIINPLSYYHIHFLAANFTVI